MSLYVSLCLSIMSNYHMWIAQIYYPHTAPTQEDIEAWANKGTVIGRKYKLKYNVKKSSRFHNPTVIPEVKVITVQTAGENVDTLLIEWDKLVTDIVNPLINGRLRLG